MSTMKQSGSFKGTGRLILTIAVLALMSFACGRDAAPPDAVEQVFRFRIREDPPTLDPALSTDNLSEAVIVNLFRGLVEMDPATLKVKPAVASSWTISNDHLNYVFKLREGVRFHNGRQVTAADVRYSFERVLRKKTNSPRRWVLDPDPSARCLRPIAKPAASARVCPTHARVHAPFFQ